MDYYDKAGLTPYLEKLGFHLVGYGCTTCIGNSGPLIDEVSAAVNEQRPRRGLGAVRQPQLRGPDQPGREDELPGLAAAGHRLRAGRHDGLRLRDRRRSARTTTATTCSCATSGPTPAEVDRVIAELAAARRCSPATTPTCSPATSAGSRCRRPTGDTFDWDAESTYVRKPPYFDGMQAEPAPVDRRRRRPGAGRARRLGDHRPHQPGRLDQGRQPGGPLPGRARRRAPGLQLLRLAARQPRGDDPRHVRQHPAAQPAAGRRRGRLHQEPADRRAGVHLRRRAGLRRAGRSRWSCWPARSTAPAPAATGRPRARRCSASGRSSPSPTSGSTART